jgi:endoglucanase
MYEFKGYGTAKVVATAPAAAGFPALQDTVEVSYLKAINKIHSNFGKGADKQGNLTLAFGDTKAKFFPDTAIYEKAKVTYTFNGKESSDYLTKNGNDLVAGNQNAIVIVTGHADETANYGEVTRSYTVIIGDGASAVNLEEYYTELMKQQGQQQEVGIFKTKPTLPLRATIANAQLHVNSKESGDIYVDVFSIMGQKVLSKTMSNNTALSLENIPTGAYLITVRQGVKQLNIRWTKK